jgi:hypothetical protein
MVANGYLYKSHALGSGNLRKWLSILWSNCKPRVPSILIKCALSSHLPRVFSVRHVPRPFHGGNNCSVSSDRRFVAKSDQTGFLRRARSLSSARSSRLSKSSLPYKPGTITSATAPGAASPAAREDWFARNRRSITSRTEKTSKIGVTWVMFSKFAT